MAARKFRSSPGPYMTDVSLLRDRVRSMEAFPYWLPAIQALDQLALHPRVTFFVGENGAGKSTLLEGIAVALGLNAEGGSLNLNFSPRDSHSPLHDALRLGRTISQPGDCYFLRAESFYNLATEIEKLDRVDPPAAKLIDSYGSNSLHAQSHGESFYALFEQRFGARGLFVLDEPEAALSPQRQLGFLVMLHDLCCSGSQFLIATHAPMIMAYPKAWIYLLDETGIRRVAYRDTEHFRVTRQFLNHPDRWLCELFCDESKPASD